MTNPVSPLPITPQFSAHRQRSNSTGSSESKGSSGSVGSPIAISPPVDPALIPRIGVSPTTVSATQSNSKGITKSQEEIDPYTKLQLLALLEVCDNVNEQSIEERLYQISWGIAELPREKKFSESWSKLVSPSTWITLEDMARQLINSDGHFPALEKSADAFFEAISNFVNYFIPEAESNNGSTNNGSLDLSPIQEFAKELSPGLGGAESNNGSTNNGSPDLSPIQEFAKELSPGLGGFVKDTIVKAIRSILDKVDQLDKLSLNHWLEDKSNAKALFRTFEIIGEGAKLLETLQFLGNVPNILNLKETETGSGQSVWGKLRNELHHNKSRTWEILKYRPELWAQAITLYLRPIIDTLKGASPTLPDSEPIRNLLVLFRKSPDRIRPILKQFNECLSSEDKEFSALILHLTDKQDPINFNDVWPKVEPNLLQGKETEASELLKRIISLVLSRKSPHRIRLILNQFNECLISEDKEFSALILHLTDKQDPINFNDVWLKVEPNLLQGKETKASELLKHVIRVRNENYLCPEDIKILTTGFESISKESLIKDMTDLLENITHNLTPDNRNNSQRKFEAMAKWFIFEKDGKRDSTKSQELINLYQLRLKQLENFSFSMDLLKDDNELDGLTNYGRHVNLHALIVTQQFINTRTKLLTSLNTLVNSWPQNFDTATLKNDHHLKSLPIFRLDDFRKLVTTLTQAPFIWALGKEFVDNLKFESEKLQRFIIPKKGRNSSPDVDDDITKRLEEAHKKNSESVNKIRDILQNTNIESEGIKNSIWDELKKIINHDKQFYNHIDQRDQLSAEISEKDIKEIWNDLNFYENKKASDILKEQTIEIPPFLEEYTPSMNSLRQKQSGAFETRKKINVDVQEMLNNLTNEATPLVGFHYIFEALSDKPSPATFKELESFYHSCIDLICILKPDSNKQAYELRWKTIKRRMEDKVVTAEEMEQLFEPIKNINKTDAQTLLETKLRDYLDGVTINIPVEIPRDQHESYKRDKFFNLLKENIREFPALKSKLRNIVALYKKANNIKSDEEKSAQLSKNIQNALDALGELFAKRTAPSQQPSDPLLDLVIEYDIQHIGEMMLALKRKPALWNHCRHTFSPTQLYRLGTIRKMMAHYPMVLNSELLRAHLEFLAVEARLSLNVATRQFPLKIDASTPLDEAKRKPISWSVVSEQYVKILDDLVLFGLSDKVKIVDPEMGGYQIPTVISPFGDLCILVSQKELVHDRTSFYSILLELELLLSDHFQSKVVVIGDYENTSLNAPTTVPDKLLKEILDSSILIPEWIGAQKYLERIQKGDWLKIRFRDTRRIIHRSDLKIYDKYKQFFRAIQLSMDTLNNAGEFADFLNLDTAALENLFKVRFIKLLNQHNPGKPYSKSLLFNVLKTLFIWMPAPGIKGDSWSHLYEIDPSLPEGIVDKNFTYLLDLPVKIENYFDIGVDFYSINFKAYYKDGREIDLSNTFDEAYQFFEENNESKLKDKYSFYFSCEERQPPCEGSDTPYLIFTRVDIRDGISLACPDRIPSTDDLKYAAQYAVRVIESQKEFIKTVLDPIFELNLAAMAQVDSLVLRDFHEMEKIKPVDPEILKSDEFRKLIKDESEKLIDEYKKILVDFCKTHHKNTISLYFDSIYVEKSIESLAWDYYIKNKSTLCGPFWDLPESDQKLFDYLSKDSPEKYPVVTSFFNFFNRILRGDFFLSAAKNLISDSEIDQKIKYLINQRNNLRRPFTFFNDETFGYLSNIMRIWRHPKTVSELKKLTIDLRSSPASVDTKNLSEQMTADFLDQCQSPFREETKYVNDRLESGTLIDSATYFSSLYYNKRNQSKSEDINQRLENIEGLALNWEKVFKSSFIKLPFSDPHTEGRQFVDALIKGTLPADISFDQSIHFSHFLKTSRGASFFTQHPQFGIRDTFIKASGKTLKNLLDSFDDQSKIPMIADFFKNNPREEKIVETYLNFLPIEISFCNLTAELFQQLRRLAEFQEQINAQTVTDPSNLVLEHRKMQQNRLGEAVKNTFKAWCSKLNEISEHSLMNMNTLYQIMSFLGDKDAENENKEYVLEARKRAMGMFLSSDGLQIATIIKELQKKAIDLPLWLPSLLPMLPNPKDPCSTEHGLNSPPEPNSLEGKTSNEHADYLEKAKKLIESATADHSYTALISLENMNTQLEKARDEALSSEMWDLYLKLGDMINKVQKQIFKNQEIFFEEDETIPKKIRTELQRLIESSEELQASEDPDNLSQQFWYELKSVKREIEALEDPTAGKKAYTYAFNRINNALHALTLNFAQSASNSFPLVENISSRLVENTITTHNNKNVPTRIHQINTLGDNNCAFNAFGLSLVMALFQSQTDEISNKFAQFCTDFNLDKSQLEQLSKNIINNDNNYLESSSNIQRLMQGPLRQKAVTILRDTQSKTYHQLTNGTGWEDIKAIIQEKFYAKHDKYSVGPRSDILRDQNEIRDKIDSVIQEAEMVDPEPSDTFESRVQTRSEEICNNFHNWFLTDGVKSYCDNIAKPGTWGGPFELNALAEHFGVGIFTVSQEFVSEGPGLGNTLTVSSTEAGYMIENSNLIFNKNEIEALRYLDLIETPGDKSQLTFHWLTDDSVDSRFNIDIPDHYAVHKQQLKDKFHLLRDHYQSPPIVLGMYNPHGCHWSALATTANKFNFA